jgi:imidazole glycerol-phosphate synthase subunit HisF
LLKTRIIPTLLYKGFGLVKGQQFDSRRAVGSPMQAVKVYNRRGVDELVFLDVSATLRGEEPDYVLIDDLADECFMPLTVGGGVANVDHVRRLLQVGADKVALNTALVEYPDVVEAAAGRFGSQCIVASIDVRRGDDGHAEAWTRSGTVPTGLDATALARRAEALGVGELLLTSIDRDGMMCGYDVDLIAAVTETVSIPVIASGGAACYDDFVAALREGGASAVAAASIFHFTEQTPLEAKHHLREAGFPVRR